MNDDNKFYGKYRGTVSNNIDPEFKGRIQVNVSDVLGYVPSSWALPCVPVAGLPGLQSGMYAVPPPGASVWVEFEHGDPSRPIWTGCFWGSAAEVPLIALAAPPPTPNMVMQTVGQNSITVYGIPGGGITLCCGPIISPTSPRIMITQAGILITNGVASITLVGPVVDINKGALTVLY